MPVTTLDDLYRDFDIDGKPASGVHHPNKRDIRDTLKKLLEGISTFPDNRVIRLNNANTGTASNIVVSASVAIPAAAYQVLYVLNVTRDNTGPVTVSGAINRELVTNTSRPIPAGYLTPGMAVLCIDTGTTLRMLSYGDMEVLIRAAQAEVERARLERLGAEAARDIAAGYASDAVSQGNVPIYATIDGMHELEVPVAINTIHVNGKSSPDDGMGGKFCDFNTGNGVAFVSGKETARPWYRANDSIGANVWDSGRYRTFIERGRRVCHLDDFSGADATGENTSTSALRSWLQQSFDANVKAELPTGNYAADGSLGVYDSLRLKGGGNGFWRASPFSFWTPDATEDPNTSRIYLVDTGSKDYEFDYDITASRQCGFHRVCSDIGMPRNYNNALDETIELWDATAKNAAGTTPASLRKFSAGLVLGSPDTVTRPSRLEGLVILPNCPGDGDRAVGARGYANQSAVVPFADWDFGMVMFANSMTEIRDVNVVGYYRERGVLIMPITMDDVLQGQGEHLHWKGGYIQGGLAVRSGDGWPIVAKTENTIDVRWTPSHRFGPSGSLRLSTGATLTYTGLQYVTSGSYPVLRFTGTSATSAITVGNHFIQRTVNAGISHSSFEDMYLADQGYATRIEGPNPALGGQATPFRAALEVSGVPCRALKLRNVTPMNSGPVEYHFGTCRDFVFDNVYTEPKAWKLTPNGAGQTAGALFIMGPQATFASEMTNSALRAYGYMRGLDMTGSVSMAPLYPATSGRFTGVTDVFNTSNYIENERQLNGWGVSALNNSPDKLLFSPAGYNIGLYRINSSGQKVRVIEGFGSSANISIGPAAAGLTLFQPSGTLAPQTTAQYLGTSSAPWDRGYFNELWLKNSRIISGAGSPEGIAAAPIGTIYMRSDGASGDPKLYFKNTGSGNTGWVALTGA